MEPIAPQPKNPIFMIVFLLIRVSIDGLLKEAGLPFISIARFTQKEKG